MNRKVIGDAFKKSLPVLAGYIVLGLGFGILMADQGHNAVMTFVMSSFIYAGSMQFVGVDLLAANASLITTAMTTLIVNARHLFYSISMYTKYKDANKKLKPYMIFALTDETYSLVCDGIVPEGDDPDTFRFLVSLFNQSYWVIGSVLGTLIGPLIPFDTTGIDFSMTALFICSFVGQWQGTKFHIPAMVGLLCSVVSLVIFGADDFLIPAMIAMTVILAFVKEKTNAE